jgi:RNA polymerase sigma factor (sigma-70 family)
LPGHSYINQFTDQLFRHEAGKIVAVLTKVFGTENLELAEDVVQDTFISAINAWKLKGIPENPSAWLYRSAKNKAIDIIRKNKFSVQFDFNDSERELLKSEYTLSTVMETYWKEDAIKDDLLRMMFACCHPGISAENQIALILKTLCGFSTSEIAKAFLTTEDTISKRLYRTKEFFRENKIKPEFPSSDELTDKTASILKTIYLIFNEGYNSTHADELIRKDLLSHAMYLCGLLCEHEQTKQPEAFAAMALMCFHTSRIDTRISDAGEIILLAEQDRTKWNFNLIEQGNEFLNKASFGNSVSTYHIEAAIAYEHCVAETFEKTNWARILNYYDLLSHIYPTPVVLLNRLTVVLRSEGADAAIKEINTSPYLKEWQKHYLFHSLMGEIYSGSDVSKATKSFEKAITLTKSEAEKKLLKKKIEKMIQS